MLPAMLLAATACSMTLDPTLDQDEVTDAEAPGLAVCSVFRSETRQYALCADPLAWPAAEHDCRLRGSRLASIESEPESALIVDAAQAVGTNVWLGATRDDALLWTWATGQSFWLGGADGQAVDGAFVRWAPNEPNNSSTVATDPERCLALTLGNSDWNDRVCTIVLPYVCERALDEH